MLLQGEGVYLLSSLKGKGLYEKFGWKVVKRVETDFTKWGRETPHPNWHMVREAKESHTA